MVSMTEDKEMLLSFLDSDDDSDIEELVFLSLLERKVEKKELEGLRLEKHGTRLNFEKLANDQCKSLFRFEKADIPGLCAALGIPQDLVALNRTHCSGLEGFCILLRRLAYPSRLENLESIFGRGVAELSIIFNLVLKILYTKWHHLIDSLPVAWLNSFRIGEGADVVHKLRPLPYVCGFINGTAKPMPRPMHGQRLFYSGH